MNEPYRVIELCKLLHTLTHTSNAFLPLYYDRKKEEAEEEEAEKYGILSGGLNRPRLYITFSFLFFGL